jgi:hypothetical protein
MQTSRAVLLARDDARLSELAQVVGVHSQVLGRLARREPPIGVGLRRHKHRDKTFCDAICKRIS